MFRFEAPYMFLLLLLPLLLWKLPWLRRRHASIAFSSVKKAAASGRSLRQKIQWLPAVMRWLAVVLLVFALARPQAGLEHVQEVTEGIAIEMVLDRSSSMAYEMDFEDAVVSRLNVAKTIFKRFVFGDGDKLEGRSSDIVGMVAFARYSDTICPMTLTHSVLEDFLKSVNVVDDAAEDGTAIGDAIALGAARLRTVEEVLARQNDTSSDNYRISSKVLILLTDGENNCGKRTVLEAGELAKKWGIKLYVIAMGGEVYVQTSGLFGTRTIKTQTGRANTAELKKAAEESGGFFREASNGKALQQVYAEIDRLERSHVEAAKYVDYKELFTPFALFAIVLLFVEQLLSATVFRRLP